MLAPCIVSNVSIKINIFQKALTVCEYLLNFRTKKKGDQIVDRKKKMNFFDLSIYSQYI